MHILVLPSWCPTKEKPVNGSFFVEQAEALSRFGHRVSVCMLFNDDVEEPAKPSVERSEYTEYYIHYRPAKFHLTYVRIVAKLFWLIKRNFSEEMPEIVHVHSFQAIKYAKAIKLIFGIPFVVTEHATWFERGLLTQKELKKVRRDYNGASAIIAVSQGLRKSIQTLSNKKIIVIPNAVNQLFFNNLRTARSEKPFRFISIGLLDEKKGFDVLLRAYARVLLKYPESLLTICGEGEERENLEKLTEQLGIRNRVVFSGLISREKCADLLCENHAFVLASRFETFGIVYVEAMASGLPIIMTKTNAWQMLISQETGYAVEIDDIDGLSEAMLKMIGDYEKFTPQTISSLCKANFSEASICEQLTTVYKSVLKTDYENKK